MKDCEYYVPKMGCLSTFDGKCIKDRCFTYKLIQKLKKVKKLADKYYMSIEQAEKLENNPKISHDKYIARCAWHNLSNELKSILDN